VKRSLLVFVEGEVTEEEYLNFFRKRHRSDVTVEMGDFHGTPLPMVEAAARQKKDNERLQRRGKGAAHEEVWCVFDTDQHPHMEKALALAAENGINVALSCPCIELWFLLHFADQTAYIERHAVQSKAKSHLNCGKALTAPALSALAEHYETAKARARKVDAKHQGDATPLPANPSSGVWRLIDSISRTQQGGRTATPGVRKSPPRGI
jgi:hypothetical protein